MGFRAQSDFMGLERVWGERATGHGVARDGDSVKLCVLGVYD